MTSKKTRDDYDSPWKEALDKRFEELLALLFPTIHERIDWQQPIEFLDKELIQVVRDADEGRRHVDKERRFFNLCGFYPEGVSSYSPGLRRSRYPGLGKSVYSKQP
jgi:hypothetical protein